MTSPTKKPATAIGIAAVAVVLAAGVAAATLAGVVTELGKGKITVSGASYELTDGLEVVDMANHPITLPEVRPGVSVELEFDDEGRLSLIRAAVVR